MNRLPWLAVSLLTAAVTAWWNAWDDYWGWLGDQIDPDFQRDVRSMDRNNAIHDTDRGGTFYAAGVGSDGD